MNTGEGIISKIYSWIWHPSNSNETVQEYALFLVLILIASFLWATVIHMIELR